jgi:hypothetical protein
MVIGNSLQDYGEIDQPMRVALPAARSSPFRGVKTKANDYFFEDVFGYLVV